MLVNILILIPNSLDRIVRYGLFAGVVAVDDDTGCRLEVGAGRRRAGRPRRYYLRAPRVLLPAGSYDLTQIATLTAYSDDEAIDKANKRLRKLLDAHLRATFLSSTQKGRKHDNPEGR